MTDDFFSSFYLFRLIPTSWKSIALTYFHTGTDV
jgi:hypothetical protein